MSDKQTVYAFESLPCNPPQKKTRSLVVGNWRPSMAVMLHAGIPASTVAAWHGHDVRMTTAVYHRVYDAGLTAAASGAPSGRIARHGRLDDATGRRRTRHRLVRQCAR